MHESVIIKIRLYEGGFGIIQSKNGKTHIKDLKVDNDKKIVSGTKQEFKIGNNGVVTKDGTTYSLNDTEESFEISFDDIMDFEGVKIAY